MSDERKPISVVVIDDHEMILQSVVRLLCADPRIIVVGTALTATVGIEVCLKQRPDVVIIDYSLSDMDAPEAIVILRRNDPKVRIVTLSGSERPGAFYASMKAGSSAWVKKTKAIQELREAVLNVAGSRAITSEGIVLVPPLEELVLHFQPIMALESERIVGFEALIRWQHPDRGLLFPASFLPLSEETGFIVEIDKWCLRQAVGQLKAWQDRFPTTLPLRMSVNTSAGDLHDESFFETVSGIVAVAGLEPGTLIFEITESVLLVDAEPTTQLLTQLSGLGVGLALDDFGTAFSSLSYLRRFPFDLLKLDISFIAEVLTSTRTLLLVEEICHLAHSMDVRCIAEGIESREQLEVLLSVGCEFGQGYFFSKSLPAQDCERLLIAQESRLVTDLSEST
jgi:EAL domain-containing protein (putative c-di-GMP-specific phosphodiesterase class I)